MTSKPTEAWQYKDEIIEAYRAGDSMRDIAKRFRFGSKALYAIISGACDRRRMSRKHPERTRRVIEIQDAPIADPSWFDTKLTRERLMARR